MNLTLPEDRKEIIEMIEGDANKGRKYESFKQTEIISDRARDYVYAELKRINNSETVEEMPIVSSISVARRIIDQEAVIYLDAPERSFTELSEDQEKVMDLIYKDASVNKKLSSSNRSYKYQKQNHIMVLPKNGKLVTRSLKNHQVDVIADPSDPERGLIYIISNFNKEDFVDQAGQGEPTGFVADVDIYSDNEKEKRKDIEQKKARGKVYVVWSKDFNFTMDSSGQILSEDPTNPIAPLIPIFDISEDKEFEYWVRQGFDLTNFSIEFNARLSELSHIMRMQGFSVAWFKGPEDMLPSNIQIGPNYILRLPVDPNSDVPTEFGFSSPDSDLEGSMKFVESLLSMFLSTRGVDPKSISGDGSTTSFTSGLERLIAMIEKFSASKGDYDTYEAAEANLYEIITAWIKALEGSDVLDSKYLIGKISEESKVIVEYVRPELIKTESDIIDLQIKKIEMGASSRIKMIMELENVDRDEALIRATEYDKDEMNGKEGEGFSNNEEGNIADIQPEQVTEEEVIEDS